jgi:CelD/BcsL family acetyltransferase involved in cellulose biosynthesis
MPESNLNLSRRGDRVARSSIPASFPSPAERPAAGSAPAKRSANRQPPQRLQAPPEFGAGTSVDLQVHGNLAEVEQEWKAFESAAERTVFQTFAWLAKWQRHVGQQRGTRPAIVLGRGSDGHLLFILQLAIERRGSLRFLTWLGSDLCDYNAPLLSENFSEIIGNGRFAAVWRDILKRLRSDRRFRFDLIDLEKLPEKVGTQDNPFLALSVQVNPSGAYVASLGPEWETFYTERRSASTRKRERRQLRQLAEYGDVRFVDVDDRDDITRTLDILISQKSRSFARMGVEDMFARPGYRDFFLDIATDLNVRALTHVSRLDVGGTTAATNLGLRFRDSYYLVLSSYNDGELSRFGPGRAHLHELLRRAIEQGYHQFDFTIGDEPYKRDWSDRELRLYDHLRAVTIQGWLVIGAIGTFRRAKRAIKQTPAVWRAYLKVRWFLGLLARPLRRRDG